MPVSVRSVTPVVWIGLLSRMLRMIFTEVICVYKVLTATINLSEEHCLTDMQAATIIHTFFHAIPA
ncbi:MAG: hypothetical protein K1X61_12225 [Chitinophagales bacterium]|nr:hypothetical protein [Chitinophagales bacterium]